MILYLAVFGRRKTTSPGGTSPASQVDALESFNQRLGTHFATVLALPIDPLTRVRVALEKITELLLELPTADAWVSLDRHHAPPQALASARHAIAAERAFIAELIRIGQRSTRLPQDIRPEPIARALVATLHGLVHHGRLLGEPLTPESVATTLFESVPCGLVQQPDVLAATDETADRSSEDATLEASHDDASPRSGSAELHHLDLRPLIAAGREPLPLLLSRIENLGPAGVLVLTAPFRPTPLIALLEGRGHTVCVRELDPALWEVVTVRHGEAAIEDLSELEPPHPLQRVLERCAALQPDEAYLARLPRHPRLLLSQLAERALSWQLHESPDGSVLLRVSDRPQHQPHRSDRPR